MTVTDMPKLQIDREALADLRFVSRLNRDGKVRAMLQQRFVVRETRGGWLVKETTEWRDVPFVQEEVPSAS